MIVDECSMLTEEQLAALLDALTNVDRLALVGDPRQLPPIGAGRPFVDLVAELGQAAGSFPRVTRGYAELSVIRRQESQNEDDVLLAEHFSGRPLDAGADEVWDRIAQGKTSTSLGVVEWADAADLHQKLFSEVGKLLLTLAGRTDEVGFGSRSAGRCPRRTEESTSSAPAPMVPASTDRRLGRGARRPFAPQGTASTR